MRPLKNEEMRKMRTWENGHPVNAHIENAHIENAPIENAHIKNAEMKKCAHGKMST